MQTIRQQTQLRSPLVRRAERGLAKPAKMPAPRVRQRPLEFIVDGTACTDDILRFPRTSREAFGPYAMDAAPKRITFLNGPSTTWGGIAVVVMVLAFFIGWSIK